MKQFLNYINGEFIATDKTFEKRAPVNNQVIGMVHEAGAAEVDLAVKGARAEVRRVVITAEDRRTGKADFAGAAGLGGRHQHAVGTPHHLADDGDGEGPVGEDGRVHGQVSELGFATTLKIPYVRFPSSPETTMTNTTLS